MTEQQVTLDTLPIGIYAVANRYDTDDECVLTLWRGPLPATSDRPASVAVTFDIRWPKAARAAAEVGDQ